MILVTVGMQLPFPRLLEAMDRLAPDLSEPVVAQTGPGAPAFSNLKTVEMIPPSEYEQTFENARVVVAHAGIGTILTAKKIGKPLIVFPRRFANGEHRNDHQLATAEHFSSLPGIHVAWNEEDLERLVKSPSLDGATATPNPTYQSLLRRIEAFFASEET